LGTGSDEDKMKVLSDHIGDLYKKLANMEADLGRKSDEIKRLTKRKWYQKILGKNKI
jgi:hypothetical protein